MFYIKSGGKNIIEEVSPLCQTAVCCTVSDIKTVLSSRSCSVHSRGPHQHDGWARPRATVESLGGIFPWALWASQPFWEEEASLGLAVVYWRGWAMTDQGWATSLRSPHMEMSLNIIGSWSFYPSTDWAFLTWKSKIQNAPIFKTFWTSMWFHNWKILHNEACFRHKVTQNIV